MAARRQPRVLRKTFLRSERGMLRGMFLREMSGWKTRKRIGCLRLVTLERLLTVNARKARGKISRGIILPPRRLARIIRCSLTSFETGEERKNGDEKLETGVTNRAALLRLPDVLSLSGYPATRISSPLSYIRVRLRVGACSREDK